MADRILFLQMKVLYLMLANPEYEYDISIGG